jgi:hypothetical protein
MESIPAFILLGVLLVIAWLVAKFVLRLTTRIIGCVLTAIVAVGIVIILLIFFL